MNEELLHEVVAKARAAGADAAEAVFAERQSLGVTVRQGALEEVEREESRDLGVRVFVGRRQATVSGSDISADGRAKLIERAVAMARLAPEDPYASLAAEDRLARGPLPDLDVYDATEPDPESLEALAQEAEDAVRATEGVTKSDSSSAGWSTGAWRLVTSTGFSGMHRASAFSVGASAIAGEGSGMESAGEGRRTRWREDLPSAASIGAEAGRRAVSQLSPRKIASTTAPVIFENRIAGMVLGPLLGAISGPAVARGVSFLKDKLGQQIFASDITITDEPHRKRGLASQPFDDEGVANKDANIIDAGVLTTWMLNTASAKQLGLETTGHASRGLAGPPGVSASNLTLQPGTRDRAALMRDAGAGLLVTGMFGPSLNPNTGDWSVGCFGLWFENGEIAYPVSEITVAGNLLEAWARVQPGSDLEFRGSANSPSLLIDALAIAGK
ncbi:MAG TPA: TldD/PmbA family protein [Caulobacteraceae bacterium]|jgi:PmbA protein